MTSDALTDWWAVLGVTPGASQAELDKALARRRKLYHPDRVAQLSSDEQALAAEELERALAAHDVLTNPRRRAEWEAARAAATAPPPPPRPEASHLTPDDDDWDDDWGEEPEPVPTTHARPPAPTPSRPAPSRPAPSRPAPSLDPLSQRAPVSVGRVLASVAAALFVLTPMTNFAAGHVLPASLRDISPLFDLVADGGFLWVTLHGWRRR
jgi:hypothetical protein